MSDARDDLREAIDRAVRDAYAGHAHLGRMTDAVLAVLPEYEQVGWLSLLGAFYEAKRVLPGHGEWGDMEPVFRRVPAVGGDTPDTPISDRTDEERLAALNTLRAAEGNAPLAVLPPESSWADAERVTVPAVGGEPEPQPEWERRLTSGEYDAACPSCGSEYRLTYLAPCHLGGADPWHSAEAPDGRVVAQWRGPHNVEVTPPDAVLGEQA